MDDLQAEQIQKTVHAYLRNLRLATQRFNLVDPKQFTPLLHHVDKVVFPQGRNGISDEELQAVVAMCVLGPAHPIPPRDIREELLGIVNHYDVSELARSEEVAIVYGCGFWREFTPDKGCWYSEWPAAVWSLGLSVEHAVNDANAWLANTVKCYPTHLFWKSPSGQDASFSNAARIAFNLLKPVRPLHIPYGDSAHLIHTGSRVALRLADDEIVSVPLGGRIVFEIDTDCTLQYDEEIRLESGEKLMVLARDNKARITFSSKQPRIELDVDEVAAIQGPVTLQLRECHCGNKNCNIRHRLRSWSTPSEQNIKFWSYVASAVKGPQRNLQTRSFTSGMYYPLLVEEGVDVDDDNIRLLLAPVEFKLCPNEACSRSRYNYRYEGDICPSCDIRFSPDKVRRKTEELLIVMAARGIYEPQTRIRCRGRTDPQGNKIECDNLHESRACPLCGTALPNHIRTTRVWVRTGSKRLTDQDATHAYDMSADKARTLAEDKEELYGIEQTVAIERGDEDIQNPNETG